MRIVFKLSDVRSDHRGHNPLLFSPPRNPALNVLRTLTAQQFLYSLSERRVAVTCAMHQRLSPRGRNRGE